jgi:hypothetical protein
LRSHAAAGSLGPAALLQKLRRAPEDRRRFRDALCRAVLRERDDHASPDNALVGAGASRIRAQLLAYHEALTFEETGSVEALAANVPEAILQLHEIFTSMLRFDVANGLLEKYLARWPQARPLNIFPPVIAGVDGPKDDFRDDRNLDLQIAPASGAAPTTFLVFCGIRHGFTVPLNVLHHCWFARYGVNVVYLRDFSHDLYLTGVKSLGDVEQTRVALRDVLSSLNARKTVCIGNSGGVFGALYFGDLLKADLVLPFSGPSSLEIGLEETERQAYPRLLQLRSEGKIEWPDLRALYADSRIPVRFYFGDKNRVDKAQAENLFGLQHVRLCPVPTSSHFVLDFLAKSGELHAVFRAAARI